MQYFLCYAWLDVYSSKHYGPGTKFCGTADANDYDHTV